MKYLYNEIEIGIEKPFKFIHVSDTHLCLADERDNERKNALAKDRELGFPNAEKNLNEIIDYATKNARMVVHTGDLIDFVSYKNLDRAKEFYGAVDCFMVAGNHEFSQYVGEAWEDENYRNQSLSVVQKSFGNDIRFSSRIVNGVNFVGVDNGYYLFDKEQYKALKKEIKKGYPIILCMHVPLHEKGLYEWRMGISPCAYLTATPKHLMKTYPEYRYRQQLADKITRRAVRLIEKNKRIKAVLTGHLHHDFESRLKNKIQYITGVDTVREFLIK